MYFRIVDVSGSEWQDYENGVGDGVVEFEAYRTKFANDNDKVIIKDTPDEFEAVRDYKGFTLRWCIRLIQTDVWPFLVSFDDKRLDVNVDLFNFYAKDDADAARIFCEYYGVDAVPPMFAIERCPLWRYAPEIEELEAMA